MVAKSYQALEVLCEPFEENKRKYVNVKTKTGTVKKVRWYEIDEYRKMYPNEVVIDPYYKCLRDVLGFVNGKVRLVKGKYDELREFYRCERDIRYHCAIGWYVCGEVKIPEGYEVVELEWNDIAVNENKLKSADAIKKVIINAVGAENYRKD